MSSLGENRVEKIFLDMQFSDREVLKAIALKKIDIERVAESKLDQLSERGLHQGIVASVLDFRYYSLEEVIAAAASKKYPLLIVLDGIEDPHNFGAILRTCDAFGVDGVIIKKNRQVPLNATVAKVSTGAIDFVKVAEVTNLSVAIASLKERGYWIVASDGEATLSYRDVDCERPIALVLGSEGRGVSRLVIERSDYKVKIPMFGHVNSLNVSVAAGILIANIVKDR